MFFFSNTRISVQDRERERYTKREGDIYIYFIEIGKNMRDPKEREREPQSDKEKYL